MLCVLLLYFQGFKYSLASPKDDLISSFGVFCFLLGTYIREIEAANAFYYPGKLM